MENITKKELWIGLAVTLICLALSITLNPVVMDKFVDNIREYQRAARIDDPEQFRYAQQTKVGNVLAYGEVSALQDIYTPELIHPYAAIDRIDEHYTMHTRQVCTTDSEGNSTCRTEVYYTWDTVDTDYRASATFKFLSVNFRSSQLDMPGTRRLTLNDKTVKPEFSREIRWSSYIYEDSDDRHFYRVLPTKFHTTMFIGFFLDKPEHGKLYYETTPQTVISGMENKMKVFNFFYYTVWILLGVGAYLFIAYNFIEVE